jgi:hypothetical protein
MHECNCNHTGLVEFSGESSTPLHGCCQDPATSDRCLTVENEDSDEPTRKQLNRIRTVAVAFAALSFVEAVFIILLLAQ